MLASGASYEPFGPLDGLAYGNGVTLALAHDLDGRITAIDALDGASPVLDLDYALYDLAGNIRTITDAGGTGRDRSYVYDELHRLIDASGGSCLYLRPGLDGRRLLGETARRHGAADLKSAALGPMAIPPGGCVPSAGTRRPPCLRPARAAHSLHAARPRHSRHACHPHPPGAQRGGCRHT